MDNNCYHFNIIKETDCGATDYMLVYAAFSDSVCTGHISVVFVI